MADAARRAGMFGHRLKELRGRAGLTQSGLAAAAGLTQVTVARYETGGRLPPWDVALALADALGRSVAAFDPGAAGKGRGP